MTGYWRAYMTHKINKAIFSLPENSPREELEKAIKNSWPQELGDRENFPYKVWLSVRKEFLIAYGFIKYKPQSERYKSKPKKKKPPTEVDGQLRLF